MNVLTTIAKFLAPVAQALLKYGALFLGFNWLAEKVQKPEDMHDRPWLTFATIGGFLLGLYLTSKALKRR